MLGVTKITYFIRVEIISQCRCFILQEKDLIIFALNSMQDADRAGGSHWSLLGIFHDFNLSEFLNFDLHLSSK